MASFYLWSVFVVLGIFTYCIEASSFCNLSFRQVAWPRANSIVELKDVNSSFMHVSSNGSVSYKGQPFFFRVRNVLGSGPNGRASVVRLALRPRERAIFFSLFAHLPYAEDVALMGLQRFAFPSAPGRIFISEIVLYFEKFNPPPTQIPTFPYLYTHSIIFDYGRYK